jgi:bleomycin hydrolase
VAIIPADDNLDKKTIMASETIVPEIETITPELRQQWFENFKTTDDHLEHIVGIAVDQNGTKYYTTKNSWGESGPFKGYHYMSEKYVKAKTVSIVVNKKALPKDIRKKLGL